MRTFQSKEWAVVLGGSSGIGLATALKLAQSGMGICVIHRDRRGAMERIDAEFAKIQACDVPFHAMNLDALSPEGRETALTALAEKLGSTSKVKILLHSIAYGNLKPIQNLEEEDLSRTIYAMGTSLLTWTQELDRRNLFAPEARVIGLTSEGNTVAWKGYAAVAAAKCALESVSRAIAVEYGAKGIRSNIVQAGVTDTPALRLIPGHDQMLGSAKARNPLGRTTLPEDVAGAIYLLCLPEANWINGSLIRVDGGEHIAAP